MTDELVTFLRARLDEDEAFMLTAIRLRDSGAMEAPPAQEGALALLDVVLDDPQSVEAITLFTRNGVRAPGEVERVLAEVDAKRSIVDLCEPQLIEVTGPADVERQFITGEGAPWGLPVLQRLALPYADHPSYQESWRP